MKALYEKKVADLDKTEKEYESAYKVKLLSYTIVHTFKAKNKLGGVVLDSVKFEIDTNLTKAEPAPAEVKLINALSKN